MSRRFRKSLANHTLISLLLMSLVLRGLIPVGFMPSTDHPFTLQVCPHAADMLMPAPMGRQGHATHSEHCPFATSAAGAPAPHIAHLVVTSALDVLAQLPGCAPLRAVRSFSSAQPRAPPALV